MELEAWLEAAQAFWDEEGARGRDLVAAMEGDARPTPVAASVMTDAWLRAGDPSRALDWLERAVENRMLRALYLAVDPDYGPLRGETRFRLLLDRMGLARVM